MKSTGYFGICFTVLIGFLSCDLSGILNDSTQESTTTEAPKLLSFLLSAEKNPHVGDSDVVGIVDEKHKRVILVLQKEIYKQSKEYHATIESTEGSSVSPLSDSVIDFTNTTMNYIVSKDGHDSVYTIELIVQSEEELPEGFLSFRLEKDKNPHMEEFEQDDSVGIIDTKRKKVSLVISANTFAKNTFFVPSFTIQEGASVTPENEVLQDFTLPVLYTININGNDITFKVSIVIQSSTVPSSHPYIRSFIFEKEKNQHMQEEEDVLGFIDYERKQIVMLLQQATVQTSSVFVPTIDLALGGQIIPEADLAQDFSTIQFYTLSSGTYSQPYKVILRTVQNIADTIEATVIDHFYVRHEYNPQLNLSYFADIDQVNNSINLELPSFIYNEHLQDIVFSYSGNYKTIIPNPSDGLELDEQGKKIITISDYSGNLKTYTLTIIPITSDEAFIQSFVLEKNNNNQMTDELTDIHGIIDSQQGLILLPMRQSTYEGDSVFIPSIVISNSATISPSPHQGFDLSNDVNYSVQSESGRVSKTYRIQASIHKDSILRLRSVQLSQYRLTPYEQSQNILDDQSYLKKTDDDKYIFYLTPPNYNFLSEQQLQLYFDLPFGATVDNSDDFISLPHTFTAYSHDRRTRKNFTIEMKKLPLPVKVCLTKSENINFTCTHFYQYSLEDREFFLPDNMDLNLYFEADSVGYYFHSNSQPMQVSFTEQTITDNGESTRYKIYKLKFQEDSHLFSRIRFVGNGAQSNLFNIYKHDIDHYALNKDDLDIQKISPIVQNNFISKVQFTEEHVPSKLILTLETTALQKLEAQQSPIVENINIETATVVESEYTEIIRDASAAYGCDSEGTGKAGYWRFKKHWINYIDYEVLGIKYSYPKFANYYVGVPANFVGEVLNVDIQSYTETLRPELQRQVRYCDRILLRTLGPGSGREYFSTEEVTPPAIGRDIDHDPDIPSDLFPFHNYDRFKIVYTKKLGFPINSVFNF